MSTSPAEGASFSIALASSTVRFGRRSSSANSRPAARLTPLNFATKMVFGPSSLMLSRSDSSNPRISDVMPTIAVMPMTMPRTVRPERSLLARSVSSARTRISRSRPPIIRASMPQSDRGGPHERRGRRRSTGRRSAVMPIPSITDHGSSRAGRGVTIEIA